MKNKISVITVVYNDVEHIRETIDSFFSQTWAEKEYIVIDGGSTDGTVDVIKEYSDKLSYWCSEPDGGIYDAMNKGVSHATGDWINILNSGDIYVSPNVMLNVMQQCHDGVDVLYGNSIERSNGVKKLVVADTNVDEMKTHVIYRHGSSFVRTEVHRKFLFDLNSKKKLGYALDWHMIHRMYLAGCKFHKVDAVIEEYELDGTSNHVYRNLWYNYLITSEGQSVLSAFFVFLKKILVTAFNTSVFYKWVKGFGVEYMVNGVLPHIPFWNLRKAYLKLLGLKIQSGSYLCRDIYFMSPWLVKIGKYCHINRGALIDARGEIEIGNGVSISHDVKIVTGGHDMNNPIFPGVYEKIIIDDYAWLGVGCTILKNVHIGYGAVVCAGAVVTKDVPPYSIVGGIPAKQIGTRKKLDFNYRCIWDQPFT